MFGCYSDKKFSENEKKILNHEPDDFIWCSVILSVIFKDVRSFQIRDDINIPQEEDDDGIVLMMEDESIVYLKTLDGDFDDDEFRAVEEVCLYLENVFHKHIKVYIPCPSFSIVSHHQDKSDAHLFIKLSSLSLTDGVENIERLEAKLKNNEKFSTSDSIDHMLIPFMKFDNKEIFQEKYTHYMNLINSYYDA